MVVKPETFIQTLERGWKETGGRGRQILADTAREQVLEGPFRTGCGPDGGRHKNTFDWTKSKMGGIIFSCGKKNRLWFLGQEQTAEFFQ